MSTRRTPTGAHRTAPPTSRAVAGLTSLPPFVLQLKPGNPGHVDRKCKALLRAGAQALPVPIELFAATLDARFCQLCVDVLGAVHLHEGLERLKDYLLAPPRPRMRARDQAEFVNAGISDLDRDRWWMLGFTGAGASDCIAAGLSINDVATSRLKGRTATEIVRAARARHGGPGPADRTIPEA